MPNEKLRHIHHASRTPLLSRLTELADSTIALLNTEFGFGIQVRLRISNNAGDIVITHKELHNAQSNIKLDQLVTQFMEQRSSHRAINIQSTVDLINDLEKQIKRLRNHQDKLHLCPKDIR